MPGFDVAKYMNRWWNIGNSPFIYESEGAKCGYADYHLKTDKKNRQYVDVANYDVKMNQDTYSGMPGKGYPNESDPAALSVQFRGFPSDDDNYWVLDTDYEYVYVWGCNNFCQTRYYFWGWLKVESCNHAPLFWLLNTQQSIPQDEIEKQLTLVSEILADQLPVGYDWQRLVDGWTPQNQKDCPVPEPEFYES